MNILMAMAHIEITGAETYAVSISDELIRRGHKVYIMSDNLTSRTMAEFHQVHFCRRRYPDRIRHVKMLMRFIREKNIDIVHGHARPACWVSYIATRLTRTPMVTTLHSRQPTHSSRRYYPAFGDLCIAICENVKTQTVSRLGINPEKIVILRNGVNTADFTPTEIRSDGRKPVVSIIGRLSGAKGNIAYNLMEEVFEYDKYIVRSIGGNEIPIKFGAFADRVEIVGHVNDVTHFMAESSAILGAGRVAMEAILMGRPVVAIGEDRAIGLINKDNIEQCLASNFGDCEMNPQSDYNFQGLRAEIIRAIESRRCDEYVIEKVKHEFELKRIVDRLEQIYREQIALKKKK